MPRVFPTVPPPRARLFGGCRVHVTHAGANLFACLERESNGQCFLGPGDFCVRRNICRFDRELTIVFIVDCLLCLCVFRLRNPIESTQHLPESDINQSPISKEVAPHLNTWATPSIMNRECAQRSHSRTVHFPQCAWRPRAAE